MTSRFRFLWLAAIQVSLAAVMFAQTDVARIVGVVKDSSGGIVQGAKVTAKSEQTGAEQSVNSDSRGYYVLTQLLPSNYTVTANSPGLVAAETSGIVLQVGQERTVNLTLRPAGQKAEVTVSAGDLQTLDTSNAAVGVNVSQREVKQLPLNGRQVSQLYLLAPGAVNNGSGNFDNIRFSGRSNQENEIRFDGVEGTSVVDASPGNLNGETSSGFRLQQSLENVREFQVLSSNYPAEYGTGTGGQISFVTKSGGNQFHGSAFEYIRNDYLDARNFFDKSQKSKLRLNQFGGSIGGPILKNKLFFFGGYEGLRQRTGAPIVESTLSAAARLRAVPSIQPLLGAFPLGQGPTADPNFDLLTTTGQGILNEDSGSIRFDYNISDRFRIYARYFRDQGNSSQTQNSTGSLFTQTAVPQNGVISFNQVWSPTILNETKFGFNGAKTRVDGVPGPSPNADLNGVTLQLNGSVALGGIAGQTGSTGIATPSGLIRLSSSFNGRGAPYTNYTLSYIDNLTMIYGNHTVKMGVEFRPITLYNDQLGGTTYTFGSVDAFLANNPTQIAFNGDLSTLSPFTGLSGNAELHQTYYVGYIQDEWKLRPNLTMNYGFRYEYYRPLYEQRNKDVVFNIATGNINPRYSQDWYRSSPLNLGPRLAFTWAPEKLENKTVFRIGSGYYYGPGQTEDQLQPEANDRIGTTITSGPQLAYPLNIPSIYANYNINSPTLGYQPRAYGLGYHIPERILEYTASIQQQLPHNAGLLTVAFVGSQGRNLFLRSITNLINSVRTNPTSGAAITTREFGGRFSEIDYKTSGGTDHYNSLQVSYNRRYDKGFTLGGQYTYGHSIGDSGGSNEANTAQNPFNFGADRGNNNFDIRHSANISTLYDLPFGIGQKYGSGISKPLDLALGGWELGGIVNARSGVPMDILIVRPDVVYQDNRNGRIYSSPVLGTDNTVYTTAIINTPGGGASRNVRRPNVVANTDAYTSSGGLRIVNPAAFTIPAPGTFGNSARNLLSGPMFAQLDLTLYKRFRISEAKNIEFRAEFYNLLNHANFANPANLRLAQALPTGGTFPGGVVPAGGLQPGQPYTNSAAGGNFGTENATVSNQIGLGTNRQIQLSLRFNF